MLLRQGLPAYHHRQRAALLRRARREPGRPAVFRPGTWLTAVAACLIVAPCLHAARCCASSCCFPSSSCCRPCLRPSPQIRRSPAMRARQLRTQCRPPHRMIATTDRRNPVRKRQAMPAVSICSACCLSVRGLCSLRPAARNGSRQLARPMSRMYLTGRNGPPDRRPESRKRPAPLRRGLVRQHHGVGPLAKTFIQAG